MSLPGNSHNVHLPTYAVGDWCRLFMIAWMSFSGDWRIVSNDRIEVILVDSGMEILAPQYEPSVGFPSSGENREDLSRGFRFPLFGGRGIFYRSDFCSRLLFFAT